MVGHFIGSRLTFLALKRKVNQLGDPKGDLEVFSLPFGFILFKFELAEDKSVVMERGPWFIFERILIFKPKRTI